MSLRASSLVLPAVVLAAFLISDPAPAVEPAVPVTGSTVSYGTVDGVALEGYLVKPVHRPDRPLPAVIVIHEWWGLNDDIRAEARRLAGEGYTVLAVDLYGGRVATEPPEAMQLSRGLTADPEPVERNLKAAYDYLATVEKAPRIASLGWCLGGRWSLRTALLMSDRLAAAVIYYGSVNVEEAELATLKAPVLGIFGSLDRGIPVASVQAFEATARKLDKDVSIQIYEGAEHAFANASGSAYNAFAAEDAWALSTRFLRQHLNESTL